MHDSAKTTKASSNVRCSRPWYRRTALIITNKIATPVSTHNTACRDALSSSSQYFLRPSWTGCRTVAYLHGPDRKLWIIGNIVRHDGEDTESKVLTCYLNICWWRLVLQIQGLSPCVWNPCCVTLYANHRSRPRRSVYQWLHKQRTPSQSVGCILKQGMLRVAEAIQQRLRRFMLECRTQVASTNLKAIWRIIMRAKLVRM